MARSTARLEGVTLSPIGHPVARFSCGPKDIPQPGQALLCSKPGADQALPTVLFPSRILRDGFISDVPPEACWRLGDTLEIWGPLGDGFTPPIASRNWLLVSLETTSLRLLPLIHLGLERGVNLSLCSDHLPTNLSPQIELNPNIEEALTWADYLALDVSMEAIPRIRAYLGLSMHDIPTIAAQALIAPPMPCGLGACLACVVRGHHGWHPACVEGPVFELKRLAF
jgi:hypothetical protein